jgi:hypothetical protein
MLADSLKLYGPVDGILYLINRVSTRFLRGVLHVARYQFLALPTNATIPSPRRLGKDIQTRRLARTEMTHLGPPRPAEVIHSRLEQGSWSLGAFKNEQLLGFIWLQYSSYLEDEVRCRYILPSSGDCAWDYDLYIDPAFRNSAAFLKLWKDVLAQLSEAGKRWSLSRVSVFAPDSLRAHLRMGAIPIGNACFVSLFGLQLMTANMPPYLHVSWRPDQAPNLILQLKD